ncbi:MAG: dATP/dGTP diphosphohydrolase domain-containing protein [Thermomicrobiales bacterium]
MPEAQGIDAALENPKDRIGVTKPPLHLIPPAAEIAEAVVMGLGAAKYGAYNWRSAKVKATIYVAAAKRHLTQWLDGQDDDPESGVSHLAHARACLGIQLDAEATGKLIDDRPPAGAAAELIERFTSERVPSIENG